MKIRTGFVSNSSSSSFCIFGTFIEEYNNEELYQKIMNEEIDMTGCGYWRISYDEGVYVGNSWDTVKDDETGKEFKERTIAAVTKALGEGLTFSSFEEAWHD